MSQGQPDVPEPHHGEMSKPEDSPPLIKQDPGEGVRVEEPEPMDISKTSLPKLAPEDQPAKTVAKAKHAERDAALEDEIAIVTKAITSVSSKAANVATRRNWRKTVIGSEHVESFVVRAILKTSTAHVRRKALDEQAGKLLAAASDDFLDRAVESRLKSIGAQKLVKMLARAGRLGYGEADLVDSDEVVHPVDAQPPLQESKPSMDWAPQPIQTPAPLQIELAHPVVQTQQLQPVSPISRDCNTDAPFPNQMIQPPPLQYLPPGPPLQQQQQSMALPTRPIGPANRHTCPDCGQGFAQSAGRKYHMEKKVCHNKAPILPLGSSKWQCDNCFRIFTTNAGLTYHTKNNVCRDNEKAVPPGLYHQRGPLLLQASPPRHPYQPSPPLQPAPFFQPTEHSHPGLPDSQHQHVQPVQHQHAQPLQSQPIQQVQLQQHNQPPPPAPALQHTPPQSIPNAPGAAAQPQGTGVYNRLAPAYGIHNGASFKTSPPPVSPPIRQQPFQATPPYSNFKASVASGRTPHKLPISSPVIPTSIGSQETPIRMPSLEPARLAEMNARLANEEHRFKNALERIPENLTAFERDEEINKQKAGHATRKSVIRRDYGVQLRKRKNRSSAATPTPDIVSPPHNGMPPNPISYSFAPINRITSFRAPPSNMMSVMMSNMTPAPPAPAPPIKGSDRGQPRQAETGTEAPGQKRRKVEYPDSPIQVNSRGMAFSAREYVDKRAPTNDGGNASRPNLGDVYGIPGGTQRRKAESALALTSLAQLSPRLSQVEADHVVATHTQTIRERNLPRSPTTEAEENGKPCTDSVNTAPQWETPQPRNGTPTPVPNQIPPASGALPALHGPAPSHEGRLNGAANANGRPSLAHPSPPGLSPGHRSNTNPPTSKSLSPVSQSPKSAERVAISSGSETSSDSSDADADIPARLAPHARRRRTSASIDSAHRTSISMESAGPSAQVSPSLATATIETKIAPEGKENGRGVAKRTEMKSLAETLALKAASALANAADALMAASKKTSTGMTTPVSEITGTEVGENEKASAVANLVMATTEI